MLVKVLTTNITNIIFLNQNLDDLLVNTQPTWKTRYFLQVNNIMSSFTINSLRWKKKKSGGAFICSIMLKGLFQEYFGRRSKLNFSISHTIQVRLHTSIGNKLIDQTPKVLLGANPDEAN